MSTEAGEDDAHRTWARWPWQTCSAVTIDGYGRCRCDLRRGHDGDHCAERGTYAVVWRADYQMKERDHG